MTRIKTFQTQHPEASLDITSDHLYSVQEALTKKKCEIAIGPRYGLDDRHAFVELYRIDMITVVSPDILAALNASKNNASGSKIKQQELYSLPQI